MGSIITDGKSRSYGSRNTSKSKSNSMQQMSSQYNAMYGSSYINNIEKVVNFARDNWNSNKKTGSDFSDKVQDTWNKNKEKGEKFFGTKF